MKKIICSLSLFAVILLVSCSDKERKPDSDKQAFQIDTITSGGAQRMQISSSENNVRLRGKDYHISIRRMPCDSLPKVKDQTGDFFVDNEITLLVTRNNGEKVFSKTFTKRSFSSMIDDGFLSKAILEGMVFDKTSENGIVLAASVSFPQTDLYVPLSVTISPEGKMTIDKEEILDENYQEAEEQD